MKVLHKLLHGALLMGVAILTACACTTTGSRGLSSRSSTIQLHGDLHASVEEMLTFVRTGGLTPENCAPVLKDVFTQAFDIEPARLDPNVLRERGTKIIEGLFMIRHHLRVRLNEFYQDGRASQACVSSVRDTLRAARVIEDYVAEWYASYPVDDPKKPVGAFNGTFPWVQTHPDHQQIDFRSGDLFISRGTAFTSAAIARITDDDANFSHLAILYIDEKTGEKWMVEAHIEVGSIVARFDDYRFDGKARAVQLRFEDPVVAHQAAKAIYEKVTAATSRGENICYDFDMNLDDRSCLFCSELVTDAFEMGSNGAVKVPRFLSTMRMKNRDFLDRIGATATTTFAPADIELDGRFTVLTEWRDLGKMNRLHEHDAILTSMFMWMEREDYVLHDALKTKALSRVMHGARRWPVFGSLLKKKFPKNMPRTALATIVTLNDIGETLMARLSRENTHARQTTGFWLTPRQMLDVLERYRQEDLRKLEAGRKTDFHHRLGKRKKS